MTPYELFEMIQAYYDENVEEIVVTTNELIGNIGQCKFTYELSEILEEYALSMDICPLCGQELKVLSQYEEDRGEYQGTSCTETMCLIGCEDSTCSHILNE